MANDAIAPQFDLVVLFKIMALSNPPVGLAGLMSAAVLDGSATKIILSGVAKVLAASLSPPEGELLLLNKCHKLTKIFIRNNHRLNCYREPLNFLR